MVLVAIGASGCGGGGSTPTTATAQDPAAVALKAKQDELRRYFSRTAAALKPYKAAHALDERGQKLVVGRVATRAESREAARLLVLAAQRYELSALRQLQAQPPAALRAINRRFASLSTRLGSYERHLGVSVNDTTNWNRVQNASLADTDARSEWRVEADAYARQLDMTLPPWAKIIGTPYAPR